MPRDLWSRIQKQLQGKTEAEQLSVLQSHLDQLHDEWKGPYKELRDRLRRRVASLQGHQSVRSRAGHLDPFHVKRQGDAQVGFVGVPNAGKSGIVRALTGATTVVAEYPFATQHPVPGMLACAGGALQLVDTPPLVPGLADGEGAGRPLLNLLSLMDAIAVVIDLTVDPDEQIEVVFSQLADAEVRPVAGPLSAVFHAKGKEGVKFRGRSLSKDEEAVARTVLQEAHVEHAEVTVRTAFSKTELRAQVEGQILTPTVLLGNRLDAPEAAARLVDLSRMEVGFRVVSVDANRAETLPPMVEAFCAALGLVTVSLLARATPDADDEGRLLVPLGSDVADVAQRLGGGPPKGARVWGESVEQPGQAVRLQHLVEAGDRIFLQS